MFWLHMYYLPVINYSNKGLVASSDGTKTQYFFNFSAKW